MEIRLAGITEESIVDGPGLRLVVFAQGCPHHCQGCHNPDTHDVNSGYTITLTDLFGYIEQRFAGNKILRGVTFSGGEPFLQAEPLGCLAERLKALGLDIVCYSGFTFEQLGAMAITNTGVGQLLRQTDILIDGLYRANERDLGLAFRGSRNQRLIDIAATLATGQITLWEDASQKRWA
ncbi:anaerobic ribonucleoside-triphosphate reductase activating protein [Sporomusa termitida]|uniref:Anaerobic ribonucleoside-triphosphate reductase-activating protein n=1 Tax=Sporomusa termitida TaxID=2377 RepID=A0A517DSR9_9FIRM|nr:anaerobic ribonucleoside-triphosphate reductase activating protein [Sporomusa termitida]QDR80401.1 NrdG: anaerobic ribonucleoside-triphosphate reductase activating protein [Sporomusa termitida]